MERGSTARCPHGQGPAWEGPQLAAPASAGAGSPGPWPPHAAPRTRGEPPRRPWPKGEAAVRPWRAGRSRRQFVRLSTPRLARTAAGEVYGWGRADSSQLGLGSGAEATEARDTPVRVPGLG